MSEFVPSESIHPGFYGDMRRARDNKEQAASDPTVIVCDRCHGTGNEFFSMYRRCSKCGGDGLLDALAWGDR